VENNNEKCVMLIDKDAPIGLIANTAGILGISLGKLRAEIVGRDVFDNNKNKHIGIIEFPMPVLKTDKETIKNIRNTFYEESYEDVTVIDFSTLAQKCKTYDEFIEKMKQENTENLDYIGILILGHKKIVNKLTGSMPLLR